MKRQSVIAFDASLLTVGVVAVQHGIMVEAATFKKDMKSPRGLEKYALIAEYMAAQCKAFLDNYARTTPVVVEAPANANGTTFTAHDSRVAFTGGLGTGVIAGVALALGFHVELIPAPALGGKDQKAMLARAIPLGFQVALNTEHEIDAAAIAAYWLAGAPAPVAEEVK